MRHVQGEDEEGETEELVNSVLDEIGIDLNSTLLHAPGAKTAQPVQQASRCILRPRGGGSAWQVVQQWRSIASPQLRPPC
jgi:hypothetical protein